MEAKTLLALVGSWAGSVASLAISIIAKLHQLNAMLATVAAVGSIIATFWLIRSNRASTRKHDAEAELAIEHICQHCRVPQVDCPLPEHLRPKYCPRQRRLKH